jgi:hypothetical protein
MKFIQSKRKLIASYDAVASLFESLGNLKENEFVSSRNLFTAASLETRAPSPKQLEVVAVVAGLPFSQGFQNKLTSIQHQIQKIIGDTLTYWVRPENFALEFFVIKWPEEEMGSDTFNVGENFLFNFDQTAFPVHFNGFQVNRDGCVVARGIDAAGIIRNSRRSLQDQGTIPARQSNWAHVPLGRILEPFGNDAYLELVELTKFSQKNTFHTEIIDKVNLVHELQWYMENKQITADTNLPGCH